MTGFVVLFSEKSGWNAIDQQAADAPAAKGAMVVGVNTATYAYAARLATDKEEKTCHNLVGDAENMSHQLERNVQTNHYFAPILVGTGQGAISLAPDAQIDTRFNPCAPNADIIHQKGLPGFLEQSATLDWTRAARKPTRSPR